MVLATDESNVRELAASMGLPAAGEVPERMRDRGSITIIRRNWHSPNLQVSKRFHENPRADIDDVLTRIATARYGADAAPHARQAWTAFSRAFEQFPYNGSVLYNAPQQMGPANLLYEKKTGYHATMVGIPYDHLDDWRGAYPAQVFVDQFAKLSQGWEAGLQAMQRVVDRADAQHQVVAESDLGVARAARLHFASVADQARFVMAREALAAGDAQGNARTQQREQLRRILASEIDAAVKLYEIVKADSRIGYEASNHYFYVPLDLVEKVVNCEYLREQVAAAIE